ncbi:hypothetical protein [Mucilaginibacter sp.]
MIQICEIQPDFFCEPCKDCGARPVLKQEKGLFSVICPTNPKHYSTKPGLVDINDWNIKNKKHSGFVDASPIKKAS